jgi:hypothetical protein
MNSATRCGESQSCRGVQRRAAARARSAVITSITQLSGFNENRIGLFRFVPMVEDAISMTTKKNASSVSLQYAPIPLIRSSTSETIRNNASRKEMSLISSQHAWNRSPKLR